MTRSAEILTAAVRGRGIASVAVIERSGAAPRTFWLPESEVEPAFLAYSITKTFMATLVLGLSDAGRLSLDDRLARWFPQIAGAERISLRRLLNHSAGIPDYGGSRAYHQAVRNSPSRPWSFEQFAAATFDKGLWFEPGEGWAYSNPGYMLVRRIVEETSGVSFRTLVAERIAQPLGLERTFVAETIDDLASLAPGTSCVLSPDGAPRDLRIYYHPGWVSHGVIASTASDVVRFLDALFRGALVSERSLAEMMELVPVPIEEVNGSSDSDETARRGRPSYGLGLMGDPESRWGLVLGHNGGGPCYNSSAFRAVERGGATVCVMGAIEEGFDAMQVVHDVLDQLVADGSASAVRRGAASDGAARGA